MSRGTQSWSPISFLVFGNEPLLPARIEQQIVNAIPSQEANIESFEIYEEALDHCKRTASVGVIFIHEDCGKQNIDSVFSQLAKPYKAAGWPVVGAVIKKAAEVDSVSALKAIRNCHDLIGYYSEMDFENPELILKMFDELWKAYIEKVEEQLIPSALQESLVSIVQTKLPVEEKIFFDRVCEVISHPLNLTWRERFQIRWHYLVQEADKISPIVLAPHKGLKKMTITDQMSPELADLSVLEITSSKKPLVIRALETTKKIIIATRKGNLEELLKEARIEARPGRPGLLRTLAAESNSILQIYADTYNNELNKKVAA